MCCGGVGLAAAWDTFASPISLSWMESHLCLLIELPTNALGEQMMARARESPHTHGISGWSSWLLTPHSSLPGG